MQEERDKENQLRVAQREAQAQARAAVLQAQRSREDAHALEALSQLRASHKQFQEQPLSSMLRPTSEAALEQIAETEAPVAGTAHAGVLSGAGPKRATSSIGTAAAPRKHHRRASWVNRRASSFDDVSTGTPAGLLLAGPKAAHQKSASHESALPVRLEKQRSRLSAAAALVDGTMAGEQLQVMLSHYCVCIASHEPALPSRLR